MAFEPYIRYHTQTPGLQVRAIITRNGGKVAEISRYYAYNKYGVREAKRRARSFRERKVKPFLRSYGISPIC